MTAEHYQVTVNGHLSARYQEAFRPLQGTTTPEGTTILSGDLPDQAALVGVLSMVERLGLKLLAVSSEPHQEAPHVE